MTPEKQEVLWEKLVELKETPGKDGEAPEKRGEPKHQKEEENLNMRIKLSKSERIIRQVVQHYNARKYWKYREIVLNFQGGG